VTRMVRGGLLVALEGVDGSGKSTLQRGLARKYRALGLRVATFREPTDRSLGKLAQELGRTDPWASGMLFTLDRLLGRDALERAVASHDLVLMDRSFYSTLAYQGSALGAGGTARMRRLQSSATVRPDRVVLLRVAPRLALRRVSVRGAPRAPLERLRTLSRVDRAYQAMAHRPDWLMVDGSAPPREVAETVQRALDRWLRRAGASGHPRRYSSGAVSGRRSRR
jgi:dTMP kinase